MKFQQLSILRLGRFWIALLLGAAIAHVLVEYLLVREKSIAIQEAQTRVKISGQVAKEAVERDIEGAEVLLGMLSELAKYKLGNKEQPTPAIESRLLAEAKAEHFGILRATLSDMNGIVRWSTAEEAVGKRLQVTRWQDDVMNIDEDVGLYIRPPALNGFSGRTGIVLSRRISDGPDHPIGVAVVILDQAVLTRQLELLQHSDDEFITIRRMKGELIARASPKDRPAGAMRPELRPPSPELFVETPEDLKAKDARIRARGELHNAPLFFVVSRSVEVELAECFRFEQILRIMEILAIGLIGIGTWFAISYSQHKQLELQMLQRVEQEQRRMLDGVQASVSLKKVFNDGTIASLYFNHNATELTKLPHEVLQHDGSILSRLIPPLSNDEFEHFLAKLKREKRLTVDRQVLRGDDVARWMRVSISIVGEQPDGFEVVVLTDDIDEEIRTLQSLQTAIKMLEQQKHDLDWMVEQRTVALAESIEARDEAQAANRAKSSFLATMSHEIRTPLNAILGMGDLLTRSELTREQREIVATINEATQILMSVINDILDFSKIEAGRLELEQTEINLEDIVETACNTIAPVAASKYIRLNVFVSPDLPPQVIGDPTRLRQIVLNLLSNAIKFSASTPNDPKCIEIEVKPAEGAQYSISVQDHGIGMTESEASRLFAPFIQADKATTRRFGGTGLGLAIVKRLVTLMNGEVSVQSAPRQGSCFTVTVPLFSAISQTTPMPKGLNGLICRVYGIAKCPAVITCLSYLHHAGIVATLSEEDAAEGEIRIVPQVLGAEPLELIHLGQWIAAIGDIPGRLSLGWMRRERLLNAIALAIDPNLRSQAFANKPTITAVEVEPEEYTHLPPKRHRLLVAEDDVINRRVIGQQLALLGYSAILVEDGKAALAAWRAGGFDLLITDMTMPEMDGLELIQIIRGEETAQMHTPIIMLSANAMQGDAERAEADGADLYLTKPIVLSELQTALKRLLHDA